MTHTFCAVRSVDLIAGTICVLRMHSPEIASSVQAGQFINIRVNDSYQPLLRRPFSVYRKVGEDIEVIFNVIGLGTKILSGKNKDDVLDVIGPLGHGFTLEGEFDTAILVAGGLGVAPFPILTDSLRKAGKSISTFLGARTKGQILSAHLENAQCATDDGSMGFHGTVLGLLDRELGNRKFEKPKIFSCGPHQMLHHLCLLAEQKGIPCEVSLESAMACGIGLCQGCPVELRDSDKKYALLCTSGPVFDSTHVRL